MKKLCKNCGEELDVRNFHKDSKSKDGYKNVCKKCRSISRRINITEERRKFDRNIKHSIYISLKYNRHGRKWERLVGYSLKELQEHLEKQFDAKMNWNNYGSYWWVDKIIPVRAYSFSTYGEFKKCWSLKNLRPLQKNEIMRKSDKVYMSLIDKYNLFDIMPIGLIYFEEYGNE